MSKDKEQEIESSSLKLLKSPILFGNEPSTLSLKFASCFSTCFPPEIIVTSYCTVQCPTIVLLSTFATSTTSTLASMSTVATVHHLQGQITSKAEAMLPPTTPCLITTTINIARPVTTTAADLWRLLALLQIQMNSALAPKAIVYTLSYCVFSRAV